MEDAGFVWSDGSKHKGWGLWAEAAAATAYHRNSERERQSSHILTEGRRQLEDFQAITFPLLELETFEGPMDKISH